MIRAWWHDSRNFGDALTPYIVKKLTGSDPVFTVPDSSMDDVYMVTGSILAGARKNTIVWGNGIVTRNEVMMLGKKYAAVRGPISAQRLREYGVEPPGVLGDPGIILPRLYNPIIEKKYELGFACSWVDAGILNKWYKSNGSVKIINILDPIESVIDSILECKTILASSLHGLVTAVAYNIPCRWVRHSDMIIGDGTKYHDFLGSIGCDMDVVELRADTPLDGLLKLPVVHSFDPGLVDSLLAACPFIGLK